MKNIIAVCANNLFFIESMFANLPELNDDIELILFNEDRIGDKTVELEKLCKKYNIKKYKVFKASFVTEKFKNICNNEFVEDYTMSMNILQLWFCFKFCKNVENILCIDDDVLLRHNFQDLFDENKTMFYYYRLSAGPKDFEYVSNYQKQILNEFAKINGFVFDKNFYEKEYLKKTISSGNFFVNKNEFDLMSYEKQLIKFFKSRIIYDAWQKRKKATSYFLDERFITFYFMKNFNRILNDKKVVLLIIQKTHKINNFKAITNRQIIHFANKSWKHKTYKMLIDKNYIKDFK